MPGVHMGLWALLVGCGDNGTIAQWQQLREQVLVARQGRAGEDFEADVALRIAPVALEDLARNGVSEALEELTREPMRINAGMGLVVQATPRLEVSALTLATTQRCAGCLHGETTLDGELEWSLGGPLGGTVPMTADLGVDLRLDTIDEGESWTVAATLTGIDEARVELPVLGGLDARELFAAELQALLEEEQTIPVAALGGADWPLVGLRFGPSKRGLTVLGRTLVGGPAIRPGKTGLDDGWELRLATDSLLALIRREAFSAGPGEMELAADPRGLSFDGSRFTLQLRLWKVAKQGWWRDLEVQGDVLLEDGEIRLQPSDASEVAASPGAEAADPIMFLGRSLLLSEVSKQLEQALPSRHRAQVGEEAYDLVVQRVIGQGNALVVRGSVEQRRRSRQRTR